MRRRSLSILVGVLVLASGCVGASVLQPRLTLPAASAPAQLTVRAGGPDGYHTSYVVAAQWNAVTATLSRDGQAIATTVGVPTVDPATQARSVTLRFPALAPGGGYKLLLEFSLTRLGEAALPAGTLTRDGITLSAGDNMLALDGQTTEQTPAAGSAIPLGAYVESMPAVGPQAVMSSLKDIVAGRHDDYFYIDDGAVHRIYRDAKGNLTTATIAGAHGATSLGNVDGAGLVARFINPTHLAIDQVGNLYVADTGNHQIRKITLDDHGLATVSTLIGGGLSGFTDGGPGVGRLNTPMQLAFDPAGNLIIADSGNHAIRRLTLQGTPTLSTIAGGASGYQDGDASVAQFGAPQALAVDAAGRIFVADFTRPRLRMMTPTADGQSYTVSTVAGSGSAGQADGVGAAAGFTQPTSLTFDENGNVLMLAGRVRKIVRDAAGVGTVSTIAGSGTTANADGPALATSLSGALGMSLDADGSLLVAAGRQLKRITHPGTVDSVALRMGGVYPAPSGSNPSLLASDGRLEDTSYVPAGLAVDASNNVYAVEGDTATFAMYPAGRPGSTSIDLEPIIPEPNNDGDDFVKVYEPSGVVTRDGLTFYYIHIDAFTLKRITRGSLDAPGTTVTIIAGTSHRPGSQDGPGATATLHAPGPLIFGPDDALYFGDGASLRKATLQPDGSATLSTLLDGSLNTNSGAGPADLVAFGSLTGLAFDKQGRLIFADTERIRRLTFKPDGSPDRVSIIADSQTAFGIPVSSLTSFALDRQDNLYVSDQNRVFTLTHDDHDQWRGALFAGGVAGFSDGPIATARFSNITRLAFDSLGRLYVADRGNSVVRRITWP